MQLYFRLQRDERMLQVDHITPRFGEATLSNDSLIAIYVQCSVILLILHAFISNVPRNALECMELSLYESNLLQGA